MMVASGCYSSPLLFNDPFDNQAGMHIDFNVNEFVNLYFNRLEEIVLAQNEPVFEDYNEYSKVTLWMRSKRETHGFPKQKLIKDMGPIVQSIAWKLKETHEALMANWNQQISRMRMFCFSEEFDNIQMWSHYADYHKGVVMKLKVAETEQEDDPLWSAKPVKYIPKALPMFTTAHIDEILGIKKFEFQGLFDMFAYNKFDIWQKEKEWRIFNLEDEPNAEKFNDYAFHPNKIHSIIFGCRCSGKDIDEIIKLANASNVNITFIKAVQHSHEYKLIFETL
jgi:hypothetical protein